MMATSGRRQPDPGGLGAETFWSRIAFFGASTLRARELRGLLEGRGFPACDVKLFDSEREGALGEYGGEALVTTAPDEETIVDLDIAFMCGGIPEMNRYMSWPEQRGFVAVDMSGASGGRPDVPVIHTEINPEALRPGVPIVAAPHPVSHNLSTLVAAVRRAAPVVRAEVLALRPASDMGERAIDELYRQTVALLNFSDVPKEVFHRQLAFNVLPTNGMIEDGLEAFGGRMIAESASMLGMEEDAFLLSSVFVPVFHGHVLSIAVTFDRPVPPGSLSGHLGSTRGVRIVGDPAGFSPAELAGEQELAVLGPLSNDRHPERAEFWTFCDNLKGGAALNVVRIAERLADMRRGSFP